jgi:hypothetical protein
MSLHHIDIESALRRLAERRIEDAMKEGKFNNLPGMGKPLVLDPMPADENVRLMWWALRILRHNDFTPHEVRWRKQLESIRAELSSCTDELRVRALVRQVNELVYKLNTLGTNAMRSCFSPLDAEQELAAMRERQAG